MVNAQEWVDQKYSQHIEELNLFNQNLTGGLIISNWPNLKIIRCGSNPHLTSLQLINLPLLDDFHASNCQLTNLTIANCSSVTSFNVSNNLLTDTEFLTDLNPEALLHLSIHSNNFKEQDLAFLSKFTKLERLFLDNHDQEKFQRNIYNRFLGSLQPLQNLAHLRYLNIANTDIDSGLEYLPVGLQKVCLVNNWERKNAGYLNIRRQIERAIKLSLQVAEQEPPFVKNWHTIDSWRQLQSSLTREEFKNKFEQLDAQQWLDQKTPRYTNRQYYQELIINDKNLTGELDLADFTSLKKLDCSDNQLTNLNLSNCQQLTVLNAANNHFITANFLTKLPAVEKLEILKINSNWHLKEDLSFLISFTNLKVLDISNCPFAGSLELLANLKNLRTINIANTDLDTGLEYLADSCHELIGNSTSEKKSAQLALLLAKHREKATPGEETYNLAKWRAEWRSNIILSIPTERFFLIRSNLKSFLDKWSVKNKKNIIKLEHLQAPGELWKQRWAVYAIQFLGRAAAVTGASFLFRDSQAIGGGVIAIFPLTELVASKLKESLKNKEEQWKEFLTDTQKFLDSYHELQGILKPIGEYQLGIVNYLLRKLKIEIQNFLTTYDSNGNETVELTELIKNKALLAQDLSQEDNQLKTLVGTLKELEKAIIEYRLSSYRESYGIEGSSYEINQQLIGVHNW